MNKAPLLRLVDGVEYESAACLAAIKRLLPFLSPAHVAEVGTVVETLVPSSTPEVTAAEAVVDEAVAVADTELGVPAN